MAPVGRFGVAGVHRLVQLGSEYQGRGGLGVRRYSKTCVQLHSINSCTLVFWESRRLLLPVDNGMR